MSRIRVIEKLIKLAIMVDFWQTVRTILVFRGNVDGVRGCVAVWGEMTCLPLYNVCNNNCVPVVVGLFLGTLLVFEFRSLILMKMLPRKLNPHLVP